MLLRAIPRAPPRGSPCRLLGSPLCRPAPLLARLNSSTPSADSSILSTAASHATASSESEVASDSDAANTGVIQKSTEESLIYFDRVLPFRNSRLDIKQDIARSLCGRTDEWVKLEVCRLVAPSPEAPPSILSHPEVSQYVPLKRDGGVFVRFEVPEGITSKQFFKMVESNVAAKRAEKWWWLRWFHPVSYEVKGVPWIEDLRRYPLSQLKVTFEGPDLTEEEMYLLFRRYGVILDIVPPPPGMKDLPRYAFVKFRSVRAATAAKNCITGLKLNDTTVHLKFEPIPARSNPVWDAIVNHQRISIPILLALAAALAVVIFDPIREWTIAAKVTHRYRLSSYRDTWWLQPVFKLEHWVRSSVLSARQYLRGTSSLQYPSLLHLWAERDNLASLIKLAIEDNLDTFIVVQGPRGSGKYELVMEHALRDRPNVLYLDCERLVQLRTDAQLTSVLASELGYWPTFPWLKNVAVFIDLAVQGLTGQKSGLNQLTTDTIKSMFLVAVGAIRNVALEGYTEGVVALTDSTDSDAPPQVLKEADYLQGHPEAKPVVVVDRFASKLDQNGHVYREMAEFAALLALLGIAHVVVITDEVGLVQTLLEVLPNRIFRSVVLSDALVEMAKNYVLHLLEAAKVAAQLLEVEEAVTPLGGRMLDLQAFVRRVVLGENPMGAVEAMVSQLAEQVMQLVRRPNSDYTAPQAWELVKRLAARGMVTSCEIATLPFLKDPSTLAALERANLIALTRDRGLIVEIRPGKPLHREAFRTLVADRHVYATLETELVAALTAMEGAKVAKWELEVSSLGKAATTAAFKARLDYLGAKIEALTTKTLAYEARAVELAHMLHPDHDEKPRTRWF